MTEAEQDRLEGLEEQASVEAETIHFRNDGILATVNFAQPEMPIPGDERNFTDRTKSTIEIRRTLVESVPLAGESITDARDAIHSIEKVTHTDLTYVCHCDVRQPV
jgi:hypothetical protein